MARTPQRRGERKFIQTGSTWTCLSTGMDVRVIKVTTWDTYKYVTYRFIGKPYKKPKDEKSVGVPYYETPLDDLTFSLRFDAKVVRKEEIKVEAQIAKRDLDALAAKVRNVTWA